MELLPALFISLVSLFLVSALMASAGVLAPFHHQLRAWRERAAAFLHSEPVCRQPQLCSSQALNPRLRHAPNGNGDNGNGSHHVCWLFAWNFLGPLLLNLLSNSWRQE